MPRHAPFYAEVQSHYDLSDDFFALFLDPTRTYSCAYWQRPEFTLEQAQQAKIDLALGKCNLEPGMTLLDIGCGWGSTLLRAAAHYDVDVIGLTLSRNQYDYVHHRIEQGEFPGRRVEVRLQGWEEFDGHADRIVSIGAFEHFHQERYEDFFDFAYTTLPADGIMLLHTIVAYGLNYLRANDIALTREDFAFFRFLRDTIFPGGQLPLPVGRNPRGVREYAEAGGFTVTRIQPLQLHYAKTLDAWASALRENRAEAIALAGHSTYDTYLRYLTGCADHFRIGHFDVMQFTCVKDQRYMPR
ncbi:cyclopropane mycolic acid synthase family methyltransferase [Nocardia huaxiensis]|uniref:cyclopropane mycolic acid synthase family methyltransferase n=1 Tax=Nocardia huaxiensis TaxID=2755382 RepID=UPI001E59F600|nr:cyclopropane mycolic acid synthase family methyltransferase [Nocardia huaxiensis]UFS98026.1 class I SAM-dependent methyltransferase [Nocardia huaxiensis]